MSKRCLRTRPRHIFSFVGKILRTEKLEPVFERIPLVGRNKNAAILGRALRRNRLFFILGSLAAATVSSGCSVLGLQQDLASIAQAAEISGHVAGMPQSAAPIFVVLYKDEGRDQVIHAHALAYDSGGFRFLVPPGTYYLFAFEDKNEDAIFQRGEKVGWYGSPSPLMVRPGERAQGNTLHLHASADAQTRLPQLRDPSIAALPTNAKNQHPGTVVKLSDHRFGADNASRGLWEPVKFLEQPGAGIFFLEPYDRDKIPVLFVHGAGGYPQQWGAIIESLDRQRFQPWILHYPSGFRLGLLGEFLEKDIAGLQLKYKFKQLYIVAHSMGGLVARSALNHSIEHRQSTVIRLLVTISTPWQGHPAAAAGVENSPLVIPSWNDMAPNSPFLRGLRETALPPCVEFAMLFGYRGDSGSDGTVLLSSMLDSAMQEAATKIYGFDEDHVSILRSPRAVERLTQLLTAAASPGTGTVKCQDAESSSGKGRYFDRGPYQSQSRPQD